MTIRVGYQNFQFLDHFQLPKPLSFGSTADAVNWLLHLRSHDPDLIHRFQEYVARYGSDPESRRLTDDQTIEQLARLLYSRKLVVVASENRGSAGKPAPRTNPLAPPFPLSERGQRAALAEARKSLKTWIAIELKDQDGNPVPGEDYQLQLPDGRTVSGKLDNLGTARVNSIDPGQCQVAFPRLNATVWALSGS